MAGRTPSKGAASPVKVAASPMKAVLPVYQEHPLPLITLNDKNKFEVGTDAIEMISKLEGDVAVITVAGLYRTGKSYILNRLLNRQEGFEIGPTVNPCTKGIFTWGSPIVREVNGRKLNIILVDTEGIGSIQQDQTYDAKIFSLAILLSSYFIYNSMGIIDERALDQLSLVVQLTKHISVKTNSQGAGAENLAAYFPTFLWLVRDFALELVDESGHEITPGQYLENALREVPGQQQQAKNEIRKSIKSFFYRRDCVTLVRPVANEKDLRKLDKINWTTMRDEFRTQVSALVAKIFAEVAPKQIGGKASTGRGFVGMMQAYVQAINAGTVPDIHNAWSSVATIENQRAVDEAFKTFLVGLAKDTAGKLPIDEADLNKISAKIRDTAVAKFQIAAMGDVTKHEKRLFELIDAELAKALQTNRHESAKMSGRILAELIVPLREKTTRKEWKAAQEIVDAWAKFQREFGQKAKGSLAETLRALVDFEPTAFGPIWVDYVAQLSAVHQGKLDEQKKAEEALAKKVEQAVAEAHKSELGFTKEKSRADSLAATTSRLEATLQKTTKDLDTAQKQLSAAQEELSAVKEQSFKFKSAAEVLTEKIDGLKREKTQLEHLATGLESKLHKAEVAEKSTASEKLQLAEKVNQLELKLTSERKQAERDRELQANEAKKTFETSKSSLQQQGKELEKRILDLERQLVAVKGENDQAKSRALHVEQEHASVRKASDLEVFNLKKTLSQRVEEVKEAREKVAEQKAKLDARTEKLNEREEELTQKKDQVAQLKIQTAALKAEIEQLKAQAVAAAKKASVEKRGLAIASFEVPDADADEVEPAEEDPVSPKALERAKAAVRASPKKAAASAATASATVGLAKEEEDQIDGDDKENEPIPSPRRGRAPAKKTATAKKTAAARAGGKRKREALQEDNTNEIDEEVAEPKAKRSKVDPNKLTKNDLKKILTAHNVALPKSDQLKGVYVDLYLANINE